MASFTGKVTVTLKRSVLDPQGEIIKHALHSLGFNQAEALRTGKYFEISVKAATSDEAKEKLKQMAEKLLVNSVIEEYQVQVQ